MGVDEAVKAWYDGAAHWLSHGIGPPDDAMLRPEFIVGNDVLDLGCFYPDKEIVHARSARRWVAIDFVSSVITKCKADWSWPPTVEFVVMDVRDLKFDAETFDTVCDFSSGDHLTLPDFMQMLLEAHRVLRLSGVFLIAYVNSNFCAPPDEIMGGECGYERRCNATQMAGYLKAAGFTILETYGGKRSGALAQKVGP